MTFTAAYNYFISFGLSPPQSPTWAECALCFCVSLTHPVGTWHTEGACSFYVVVYTLKARVYSVDGRDLLAFCVAYFVLPI